MLTFVIAYNNDEILRNNILASPDLKESCHQIIVEEGKTSAAETYNIGIDKAENEIMVFVHQDVYLPAGWVDKLRNEIRNLERMQIKWGVIGCYGICENGKSSGYVFSNGLGKVLGAKGSMHKALTVDEMVIILNRATGLKYDIQLPGYHLYGTDICLQSDDSGYENYIMKNFCVHNSLPVRKFNSSFWKACGYIRKKWSEKLPIRTPCIDLPLGSLQYYVQKWKMNVIDNVKSWRTTPGMRMELSSLKKYDNVKTVHK